MSSQAATGIIAAALVNSGHGPEDRENTFTGTTAEERGMGWYKALTINQRINVKECFELLCGVKWEQLSYIFTMRERIELMYNKLLAEGFDV